jgi:PhzF family phenazine biosynthesis protein
MKLAHFVVDAFTKIRFRGNSAAICVVDGADLDDDMMRAVARENNLSETAFIKRESHDGAHYSIRWLTPAVEVDLCGHATLASAHVVLTRLAREAARVTFDSKSGPLVVERGEDPGSYAMDFPARGTAPTAIDGTLSHALGVNVVEQYQFRDDVVCVLESADAVASLAPDFAALRSHAARCVCVTARAGEGKHADVDFVSRFFAPNEGIDEDPVTGSAHCMLGPLWEAKLGRNPLRARQLSKRGGEVGVEVRGDRVVLRGQAVLVVEGTIEL